MLLNGYRTTKTVRPVIPCHQEGRSMLSSKWILLTIENTTAEKKSVSLFDASGKFLFKEGVQTQAGVTITQRNGSYEALMNDLASGDQYCIDFMRVEITKGNDLQLDNPWTIKEDVRFSKGSSLLGEIYPSVYKTPMDQQGNRVDIPEGFTVTRQIDWSFDMEAETTMAIRIHLGKVVLNG